MNPFLRKILDATHLTREGKLAEATAAIQRALMRSAQAGAHSGASRTSAPADAAVIDIPAGERAATVDEAPRQAAVVVEPAAPRAVKSSGSGRFLASSFTGADGTRAFKLFVPGGFEGEALPLVVMLHGCTQDPDDFAAGTRMNALAQEQGFVVLYPAQAPRSNSHKCWNWFSPRDQRRGAGEPALLAGMTRHVLQTHSIDRDRVFVAGLSAGGAMAAILAREYPDLFAAAGIHSGVAPGMASDVPSAFAVMKSGPGVTPQPLSLYAATRAGADAPARGPSVPVIVFHGDADQTVAPANGDAVVSAAIGDSSAVMSTREAAAGSGARPYRRTVWHLDGDVGAPSLAEQWVVGGAPHAWSGGAATGSYTDPAGPDASREMLRFFREHPRRV